MRLTALIHFYSRDTRVRLTGLLTVRYCVIGTRKRGEREREREEPRVRKAAKRTLFAESWSREGRSFLRSCFSGGESHFPESRFFSRVLAVPEHRVAPARAHFSKSIIPPLSARDSSRSARRNFAVCPETTEATISWSALDIAQLFMDPVKEDARRDAAGHETAPSRSIHFSGTALVIFLARTCRM